MNNDNLFLDTNILIYAYSDTEIEKRNIARDILKQDFLIISTQVINEFVWIMNRKYNISFSYLRNIVEKLFIKYSINIVDENIITKAIELSNKLKYSYWDGLIISSALNTDCYILYSEDMHHNQLIENELTIKNPFIVI